MKDNEKLLDNIHEFTLESGIRVAVVEDSSINKVRLSAIVNVGLIEPGFLEIGGAKVDGLVALVMSKAFNYTQGGKISDILIREGVYFDTSVTDTKTIFTITTKDNVYEYIARLMSYFSTFHIEKNSLELAKKEAILDIEDRLKDQEFIQDLQVSSLVFDRDNKVEILKSYRKRIESINATILRKFFARFYVGNAMKFFIMGPINRDVVKQTLESNPLKKSDLNLIQMKEENWKKDEGTPKSFYQKDTKKTYSKVALAIKFPTRKDLYNKFGDDIFSLFSFIPNALFSETSPLICKAIKKGLITVVAEDKLIESKENILLLASFVTFCPDELFSYLNSNAKNVIKCPSRIRFAKVKQELVEEIQENEHNYNFLLNLFIKANSNNVSIENFVTRIQNLSYKKMEKFVIGMKKAKLITYVERGKNVRS